MLNKPYHHGDLRNSLIEAGIELINQDGAKQLSLRKVSALCGSKSSSALKPFSKQGRLMGSDSGLCNRAVHGSIRDYDQILLKSK